MGKTSKQRAEERKQAILDQKYKEDIIRMNMLSELRQQYTTLMLEERQIKEGKSFFKDQQIEEVFVKAENLKNIIVQRRLILDKQFQIPEKELDKIMQDAKDKGKGYTYWMVD